MNTPIIAEDWKYKATANSNGFEGIGCLYFGERWKRTNCTKCTTSISTTLFCVCNRTRTTAVPAPVSSRLGMDLKLLLHGTITKSGIRSSVIWSSFERLFFDVLAISNVSFKPLYKGVKTSCLETQDSYNNLQVPKTLLKLFHIKVHLEFLNNFHILEILES